MLLSLFKSIDSNWENILNYQSLKKNSYFKTIILLAFIFLKILDIFSKIFNKDYSKEYLIFRSIGIERINEKLLKLIYGICDIFIYIKLKNLDYMAYSILFPNSISSLENFILIYNLNFLFPLLYFIDPLYFLILPAKAESLAFILLFSEIYSNSYKNIDHECYYLPITIKYNNELNSAKETQNPKYLFDSNLNCKFLYSQAISSSNLLTTLKFLYLSAYLYLYPLYRVVYSFVNQHFFLIYKIGYSTSHLPSLSGFWYQSICMIEQYSHFNYTIFLFTSTFLLTKEKRLLPVLKNNSNFISYLPYILHSKHCSILGTIALIFEYLLMIFKKWEIVNTNFLYWTTLSYVILYIYDIKIDT